MAEKAPLIEDVARRSENVAKVFSETFKKNGWPNWNSTPSGATTEHFEPLTFTIRMDSTYRAIAHAEEPARLFDKAVGYLFDIREMMEASPPESSEIIEKNLIQQMTDVVFGSNNIERVGLSLEETVQLCGAVFRGDDVDGRSPLYRQRPDQLARKDTKASKQANIRSWREVTQHALALRHITTVMAVQDQPLTEELILDTHKILCSDIDIDDGPRGQSYAGHYRTVPVRAGNCGFVPPHRVPAKMRELVEEFNQDITRAEKAQTLDPFSLAAKYCQAFVMIHPFLDGNGRTCRLILNAILLKYAGILVPLGENDESRQEYLGIARRAGEQMEGSGELATLILRGATSKLRSLKQKLRGRRRALDPGVLSII